MELITIIVGERDITVVQGKVAKSRLKYSAPGLEIYLLGKVKVSRRPVINHTAMENALARHIPLISLKSHGWV